MDEANQELSSDLSKSIHSNRSGLVGYTWYRWIDINDRDPPFGFGLVKIQDEPNLLHTDLLTQLNAKAETIATTDFGYPVLSPPKAD